ncbi:hypothetical protein R3P38DRAFT_3171156 [Favolaschia claudopus]|uniref:Uncharacterized protein n=1 Tax=Favolaschia claudopus TaxID=2862362 RepID=A0AAW0DMI8_9AGAR
MSASLYNCSPPGPPPTSSLPPLPCSTVSVPSLEPEPWVLFDVPVPVSAPEPWILYEVPPRKDPEFVQKKKHYKRECVVSPDFTLPVPETVVPFDESLLAPRNLFELCEDIFGRGRMEKLVKLKRRLGRKL